MRHVRVWGFAGLAIAGFAAVALARTDITPLRDPPPVRVVSLDDPAERTLPGDAANGAALAAACSACHGVDGNSPVPLYPSIAGQGERYIARQLALIASGQRDSAMTAVMLPFVQGLSAQDMRDLGAYYAAQASEPGVADDALIQAGPHQGLPYYRLGERLYRGGDLARGIPACIACHGPAGAGNPGPPWPRVAGQHQDYTAMRLEEFRDGQTTARDPALFNVMADAARALTAEDIQALATYLQGLHPAEDDVAAARR